jgi:hypothetical protein
MKRINVTILGFASLLAASNSLSQAPAATPTLTPLVLMDSVKDEGTEKLRRDAESLGSVTCTAMPIYLRPTAVGAFIGGKAIVLRVLHTAGSPSDVPKTLEKVWNGQFQTAWCHIGWDEGALWSIEANVEFEDGKQAKLFTGGSHVAFQDHAGNSWFICLLPAAQ